MDGIPMAERAVVAIKSSPIDQVCLVGSHGISEFSGGPGHAGIHSVAGYGRLQMGWRIIRAHVDETQQRENEACANKQNCRQHTEEKAFHRALLSSTGWLQDRVRVRMRTEPRRG